MGFVYKITNLLNGKAYIGKTTKTVEQRWRTHVQYAAYKNSKTALVHAIRKYGPDAFRIETIIECAAERLDAEETRLIAEHKTTDPNIGYNCTHGGDGGSPTAEVRQKISLKLKGRTFSEATLQKLRTPKPPRTEEFRAKCRRRMSGNRKIAVFSANRTGTTQTPAHIERRAAAIRGRKHSEETKRKIRDALARRREAAWPR